MRGVVSRKTRLSQVPTLGRPTLYEGDETIRKVLELDAATLHGIARHLGVTRDTLRVWCKKSEDLTRAVNQVKGNLVAEFESAMAGQAKGDVAGNATAGIFMLKNLAPDEYRDRREHAVEVKGTVVLDWTGFDEEGGEVIEADYEDVTDEMA